MRLSLRFSALGLGVVAAVLATGAVMEWRMARAVSATRAEVLQETAGGGQRQDRQGLAFERAKRLRRGVNLSGWYSPKPDYSSPQLAGHMSGASMRALKELGFDHVRLCIDPEGLIAEPRTGELWPDGMAVLSSTVRDLNAAGLNVVLDVQPEESWKALLKGKPGAENFFAFWTVFATYFSKTDPDKVFFEVMNEPTMDDPYRWEGIQAQAVERIRKAAPRHTVIATAAPESNLDSLLAMEPVRDENVIYTFHDYDPKWFTHQGATWAGGGLAGLRGVPYPATPKNIQAVLDQEPDEAHRLLLERSGWDRWDASRMAMEVAAVDQWAQRRGVPLYCGEFGVYKKYSDPKARARWISDMRSALEAGHIGWTMWDYDGNFGLMNEVDGKVVVDEEILHALGLSN